MQAMAIQLAAAAALAQFLVCAILALFGRRRPLMISSGVLALAWLAIFGAPLMPKTHAVEASAVSSTAHGSCASVEPGMTADAVAARVGQPDEKRSDDDVRGPGAAIWIYRDSRCAVHVFDGKVEAID